jgi:hypothetical protein
MLLLRLLPLLRDDDADADVHAVTGAVHGAD